MTRRSRGRWRTALGATLLAAAAIALGLVALAPGLRPAIETVDPDTLCPVRQPPAHTTMILVDATDALEPRHRRRIEAAIRSERQRLAKGDRLTLAILSDHDPREPIIAFSKCNPGDGADANPWLQNPARRDAQWRTSFGDPLEEAVARALKGRAGTASPLTDAIGALSREPEFAGAGGARRLVIASDMMEHRPGVFSLYAAGATYASFRHTQAGLRPSPDLAGVDVRIVQLDRPDREARQMDARDQFWAPYFTEAGAHGAAWDP